MSHPRCNREWGDRHLCYKDDAHSSPCRCKCGPGHERRPDPIRVPTAAMMGPITERHQKGPAKYCLACRDLRRQTDMIYDYSSRHARALQNQFDAGEKSHKAEDAGVIYNSKRNPSKPLYAIPRGPAVTAGAITTGRLTIDLGPPTKPGDYDDGWDGPATIARRGRGPE